VKQVVILQRHVFVEIEKNRALLLDEATLNFRFLANDAENNILELLILNEAGAFFIFELPNFNEFFN
jgi:hypothetical protein